jgi:hypothetical protein
MVFCQSFKKDRAQRFPNSCPHSGVTFNSICFRKLAHDNHTQNFVFGDVLGSPGSDQLAVLYDRHAVRQVEYIMQVMADQKDTDALAFELLNQFGDHGCFLGAEGRGGFVHD